ncbi:MAG TPA: O-unit flippase-like protein [Alphaproteobacteria bacterium]|nr:O-unit flippase-like protein [Alphaproteobacteria bacterium]
MTISRKDVAWSYVATFFRYGFSLLTIPLVAAHLTSDEMGVWIVFQVFYSLLLLLDLGMSQSITRSIAFAWSGAQEITKQGVVLAEDKSGSQRPNERLITEVFAFSDNFFKKIGKYGTLVMASGGSYYLYHITKEAANLNLGSVFISWFLYLGYLFLTLRYNHYAPSLIGIGDIAYTQRVQAIAKILSLASMYVLVINTKLSLIGVGAALLAGGIFERLSLFARLRRHRSFFFISKGYSKETARRLMPNAIRLGVVSLCAFLINQTVTIVISFKSLSGTGSYGLSIQAFSALAGLAAVVFRSNIPRFSALQIRDDVGGIRHTFTCSMIAFVGVYALGSLFIVLAGSRALEMLGSATRLLPMWMMLILGIMVFLENNHGLSATLLSTRNEVPFFVPSIVSGITMVLVVVVSQLALRSGLLGLVIGQMAVQLAYNNWKWPLEVFRQYYRGRE